LTEGEGKVTLTTQYRVPKDIADMLNAHIYRGLYNSCPCANIPSQGLKTVNVTEAFSCNNRKYVNEAEVARGIALVRDLMNDDQISSILIITPVSSVI
jgi:superfamily I DNA and/or RNA helicase